jgi:hypothetical protein
MKGLFKPKRLIALGTGVLLVSALAVSLAAGPLSRSQAAGSNATLHVFDHAPNPKFITVGTPSDPRGNYVVFSDPVFDASDTHQIGHATGMCVLTSKTVQHCQITFLFSGGAIAIQGPQLLSGATSTMVIVGGTGVYRGKEGAVTWDQVKKSTELEFEDVFHFA